jgi:hypothetical protein
VTWYQVPRRLAPTTSNTFQAVMFDSGDIVYHYNELQNLSTYQAVVGVNDPKDPSEPTTNTISTKYSSQMGRLSAPSLQPYTTHYYFVTERF